jgi:prostamide/prostaglandin F2alpha synthase
MFSEIEREHPGKVKLVGIGFDILDYQRFVDEGHLAGGEGIFLDKERAVYNALHMKRASRWSLFKLITSKFRKLADMAKGRGIKGNLKGDGYQLGGTVVLDQEGAIVFKHLQDDFGCEPDFDQLDQSIRAKL